MTRHTNAPRYGAFRLASLLFPPQARVGVESAIDWLLADPVFERIVASEH